MKFTYVELVLTNMAAALAAAIIVYGRRSK